MKEHIFEGKTEDDALLKASEELKCSIRDIEYEILEETGSKFFGLFGKSVKIRVNVRESAYEEMKPVEKTRAGREVLKGEDVRKVASEILNLAGVSAELELEEDSEKIFVNIVSKDEFFSAGRNSSTVEALQFIVNRIVNRFPEDRKRIIFDFEGSKEKRESSLTSMAKRLAEKALSAKKIIKVYPMNPQDRRIIHLALRDYEGIVTKSEGDGVFRKLFIVPAELDVETKPQRQGRRMPPHRPHGGTRRER
ncbi:MAG: Jag N-terminal domain-containing protein, partial [Deltaproteobacteria bacterium]|nr:Jag N-terminal domain-containing protein [Deltaproteobacteria bacterium]